MEVIRFGGAVVRGTLAGAALVLAGWVRLLLEPALRDSAFAFGFVPLAAAWALWVLVSFRLELTPLAVIRRLGPLRLACPWKEVCGAGIEPVPGFGRVRLVVDCAGGGRISLPLFLLSIPSRRLLGEQLRAHLPPAVAARWVASGADGLLRGG